MPDYLHGFTDLAEIIASEYDLALFELGTQRLSYVADRSALFGRKFAFHGLHTQPADSIAEIGDHIAMTSFDYKNIYYSAIGV